MLREVQLQAEVTDLDLVLVREGLVCLEEAAADLALKELKGQDLREVEAKLALEDLVGVEDCVEDEVEDDVSGGEVVIPLGEESIVLAVVMKAVPILGSLRLEVVTITDDKTCILLIISRTSSNIQF